MLSIHVGDTPLWLGQVEAMVGIRKDLTLPIQAKETSPSEGGKECRG